jgi:hypothetical protein
MGLNASNV